MSAGVPQGSADGAGEGGAAAIRRAGVVGAGQMGRGIAQVLATAGIEVVLVDAAPALADRGRDAIAARLDDLVAKRRLDAPGRDAALARLRAGAGVAELAAADFVVEAAPEDAAIKTEVFAALDAACAPHAILASNTSSIAIARLAAATRRPDRVVGMHFMNPVPVMKLVEIVRADATSDATLAATRALAARLGKVAVVARDVPGFVVNRVLMPLINEAAFALEDGVATREDIDRAIVLGLAHPMGPLALADLIGLDTVLAILRVLHRELPAEKFRPCPLIERLVARGDLGRKAGRGFFDYAAAPAAGG